MDGKGVCINIFKKQSKLNTVYDLLININDTHCGSRLGLCPPNFIDREEGNYYINKIQRWIWDSWDKFWDICIDEKHPEGLVYLVINGDVFEWIHRKETELVTNDESEQLDLALSAYDKPMSVLNPDYTFVIEGTEVHAGKANQAENVFAKEIKAEPYQKNNYVWPFLDLDVRGTEFDIAHHGRAGYRSYTRPVAASYMAADLTFEYSLLIDEGLATHFPDIALRAHVHYRADSGRGNYPIRVMYTPSWQAMTHFANRVSNQRLLRIGGRIFKLYNNHYSHREVFETIRRQAKWKPTDRQNRT